jgi:hypothetical protein
VGLKEYNKNHARIKMIMKVNIIDHQPHLSPHFSTTTSSQGEAQTGAHETGAGTSTSSQTFLQIFSFLQGVFTLQGMHDSVYTIGSKDDKGLAVL